MTIANFEHPIQLYHVHISLEDWLAKFFVEVGKELIELPPPSKAYWTTTVTKATYLSTSIEGLVITRENLVAIFSEEEVAEQELEASFAYLESLSV